MSNVYAPVMRALVVAALALATVMVMLVAVNTVRVADRPVALAFSIND